MGVSSLTVISDSTWVGVAKGGNREWKEKSQLEYI